MLKELYIDNFHRFINQRIELSETMLIIGKNGVGKTTLIELVHRLKRFIVNNDNTGHVSELVTADALPRWLKSDYGQPHSRFEMKYDADGSEYIYELEIQHNLRDSKQRIFSEKLVVNHETVYKSTLEDDHADVITDDSRNFKYALDWSHSGLLVASRVSSRIRTFLQIIEQRLFVFILNPDGTGDQKSEANSLAISGNNFNWWYGNMLTQDIETASEVLKSYRDFLPNCKRTFIAKETKEFTIEEDAGEKGFEIKFSELSIGQKKLCIYYALFKMLPIDATVLFDEFENHLSPMELQPLYDMMQEQQDAKGFQIVLVSHHHKTINWYHDSALVFSLSGKPAHIKIDQPGNTSLIDLFYQDPI